MAIPQKLVKYFAENKNKPKAEVIKELIKKFNYAESTALSYYSNRNVSSNLKSKKEKIFNFFRENPEVLEISTDTSNEKYMKKFEVSQSTYVNYKSQYRIMNPIETEEETEIEDQCKYYKGRLRGNFFFDDSKLFGGIKNE